MTQANSNSRQDDTKITWNVTVAPCYSVILAWRLVWVTLARSPGWELATYQLQITGKPTRIPCYNGGANATLTTAVDGTVARLCPRGAFSHVVACTWQTSALRGSGHACFCLFRRHGGQHCSFTPCCAYLLLESRAEMTNNFLLHGFCFVPNLRAAAEERVDLSSPLLFVVQSDQKNLANHDVSFVKSSCQIMIDLNFKLFVTLFDPFKLYYCASFALNCSIIMVILAK